MDKAKALLKHVASNDPNTKDFLLSSDMQDKLCTTDVLKNIGEWFPTKWKLNRLVSVACQKSERPVAIIPSSLSSARKFHTAMSGEGPFQNFLFEVCNTLDEVSVDDMEKTSMWEGLVDILSMDAEESQELRDQLLTFVRIDPERLTKQRLGEKSSSPTKAKFPEERKQVMAEAAKELRAACVKLLKASKKRSFEISPVMDQELYPNKRSENGVRFDPSTPYQYPSKNSPEKNSSENFLRVSVGDNNDDTMDLPIKMIDKKPRESYIHRTGSRFKAFVMAHKTSFFAVLVVLVFVALGVGLYFAFRSKEEHKSNQRTLNENESPGTLNIIGSDHTR